MIQLKQVETLSGQREDIQLPGDDAILDASQLTLLPGPIDPHVHFRVPGQAHKEDWRTAARATLCGGYTAVFDMPNNIPACVSEERLKEKKAMIDAQLAEAQLPLRYGLYLGADRNHFDQIPVVKNDVIGVKIFMGSSTGDLLIDDDESLERVFEIAAENDLLVSVHAEDECMIQEKQKAFPMPQPFSQHSVIRSPDIAAAAVKKAIACVERYGTRLYILHVSTQDELELIANAKQKGLPVFAEACPHHLFMNDTAYEKLNAKAQMNPPLRAEEHRQKLIEAIRTGVIDTLGSDHAPHTEEEKDQPYGKAPSGVPGIETNLPLLLNAVAEGHLSLEDVVKLTHEGPRKVLRLPEYQDYVLVNRNLTKPVRNETLKTKCAWSPFHDRTLTGWPTHVIVKGQLIDIATL